MCEHPGVKSWPCASASDSTCPAGPTLTTRDRAECGYIEKSGYRRLLLTLEKLLEGPRLRGGMRHAPCKSSLWPILHAGAPKPSAGAAAQTRTVALALAPLPLHHHTSIYAAWSTIHPSCCGQRPLPLANSDTMHVLSLAASSLYPIVGDRST